MSLPNQLHPCHKHSRLSLLCWSALCSLVYLTVTCYTNKSRVSLMGPSVIPARCFLTTFTHSQFPAGQLQWWMSEGWAPCDRQQLCINNKPSAVKKKETDFLFSCTSVVMKESYISLGLYKNKKCYSIEFSHQVDRNHPLSFLLSAFTTESCMHRSFSSHIITSGCLFL